jgi:hypothetical protein
MMNCRAVAHVLKESKSRGTDRLVLLAIAHHVNELTGACYPGRERIAKLANCHPDSVRKSVSNLIGLGELEVELNGGPGRSKASRPNLYRLTLSSQGLNRPPGGGDETTPEHSLFSNNSLKSVDGECFFERDIRNRDKGSVVEKRSSGDDTTRGGDPVSGGQLTSERKSAAQPVGRYQFRKPYRCERDNACHDSDVHEADLAGPGPKETVHERLQRLKAEGALAESEGRR